MFQAKDMRIEQLTSLIDYLKHLTTLSTGAIVLIATFWEKLSAKPRWKPAVAVSIVGFMLSILSSAIVHTFVVLYVLPGKPEPEFVKVIGGTAILLIWLGFLAGILGLSAFAIKNISGK